MPRTRPSVVSAALAILALAVSAAVPAAAQYRGFGKNKVQYRDFDWQIYHSTHFDVYYYAAEEQLLEKVVSFAESAYDQLSREFDFQIQEPTPLIFYGTHSAFEQNNIILNFIPEGIGAFASPARNRMVLPVDLPDPELMNLLLHELTHIFQYHILFQGSLGKAATLRPPQWFMEGMASYMAQDESANDKMVLRDAVVNDNIPTVAQGNTSGYFAYRFGNAVFTYIEERWGREGFLDFVYEVRNTIGGRVDRALERSFRIQPEDFDVDFRRWLRKRYLRELLETGEPTDYGRPFRVENKPSTQETSPIASPSGDLIAAVSAQGADLDIVLFNAENRRQVKNLTKGFTTSEYRYLVVQGFQVARSMGRDLTFSPDGNYLAVFARRNEGRNLLLIDVINGGISRNIPIDVEQQTSPAFSPDGRYVAFAGNRGGYFDIYLLDLETEEVTQVTDDEVYDGAPTFDPDGQSLVFTSSVGDYQKLFRVNLDDPSQRYQLTFGESNDKDAIFSADGRRLYFTSDRDGYDNIFRYDLDSGELRQYTNVVTGAFMPTVVPRPEGGEDLVFTSLWDGDYKLYLSELDEPVGEPEMVELAPEPQPPAELPRFEPAIEVAVDDANKEGYHGRKFFLENADTAIAVDNNQTFIGQIFLSFSDYLGDRRIFAVLSSFDTLSNFDITYTNLSDRLQWQVNLTDYRDFFFALRDPNSGTVLDRRGEIRLSGASASLIYPFSDYVRWEGGAGYYYRRIDRPIVTAGGLSFNRTEDDFPFAQTAFVGDSTLYAPWGPVSGRRWRFDVNYAPDFDNGGTLTSQITADYRQYWATTVRTGFAFRAFGGAALGNNPNFFYLGGETIRGFGFRELTGDRAAFINLEYRFPLVDFLITPVLNFRGIRGRVFLDVGAVWDEKLYFLNPDGSVGNIDNPDQFQFWNSDENRLEDGIATYGFGFTVRFLGLDLNWDFAKRWDFEQTLSDYETTFYIGLRF